MTQKPDTARNASGMERVGKRKLGYNVSQVNAFLDRAHALYESEDAQLTQQDIQDVSFDLEHNGYVIGQVDAALSRLERAVVDKCTEQEISECGRVVWKARAEALYRMLLQHAQRDYRDRFDSGLARRPSYARKQVDIMVDQALDKIALMLGREFEWETDDETLRNIDADYVSNVIFTQRTGKHGYDERQVDHYLNACIRLLSSLESLNRLDQYVDADIDYDNSRTSAHVQEAPAISVIKPASSTVTPPSFAASGVAAAGLNAGAEVAGSAAGDAVNPIKTVVDVIDDTNSSAHNLPNILPVSPVPSAPNHEKQSIFAPVDYSNQQSNSSFEALNQSERAIFTSHSVINNSADSIDDTDSNDDLLQSATVMRAATQDSKLPPAFSPSDHHNETELQASNPPTFAPQTPVTHLTPSKPLSLDIPDLSFPIIDHVDESRIFDDDLHDDDTGESKII